MRKLIVIASFVALLAFQPAIAQTNTSATATKPVISAVTVSSLKNTSAIVTWTTDVAATSYVDFGTSDLYGNTLGEGSYVTSHSVTLLGMSAGTLYHFRVRSKEAVAGLESVSTDTTLTTAASAVNTNVASNTNTATNTNKNSNANTNTNLNANKNTNTATNKNANKNTNTAKNTNTNRNTNLNSNLNANTNTSSDIFNQNINSDTESVTGTLENTNEDITNVNSSTTTSTSDGRAGIILIIVGVLLLVGIIYFAWRKARQSPVVRP